MKHCVTRPTKPFRSENGTYTIHQVPAASDNFIWLIEFSNGQCAAVDGPSAKEVLAYCAAHNLSLTTIINTHTHWDHIGINKALQNKGLLQNMRVIGSKATANQIPGITEEVQEGDIIHLGEGEGTVMLTEGHLNGHISILFEDVLFCGDTLFSGGCGYLFDGPPSKMHFSLQKLASLSTNVKVCCAHEYTEDNLRFAYSVEPDNVALQDRIKRILKKRSNGEATVPSTIGEELATNPFIRFKSQMIQSKLSQYMSLKDTDPVSIFAATRALKDKKNYKQSPWPPSFITK